MATCKQQDKRINRLLLTRSIHTAQRMREILDMADLEIVEKNELKYLKNALNSSYGKLGKAYATD